MQRRVVGVFYTPWNEADVQGRGGGGLVAKFRYAIWFKANPRSESYMHRLFSERYPEGHFVVVGQDRDWLDAAGGADTVVLLYPDAIGLRFGSVERRLRQSMKAWSSLQVLNGRHREFLLDAVARRGLALRRFLEVGMLGELAFLPVFVFATALFLIVDLLRGHR